MVATSLIAATLMSPLPIGKSDLKLMVKGVELEVFCYKPATYRDDRFVMVCHGTLRNASEYRDDAIRMADRLQALIVAPKFDSERFPSWRYQRGGIVKPSGEAAAPDEWTYAFLPEIADQIRKLEEKPNLPLTLIGHSAGGQFLTRLAGFTDAGAVRIVASNAGSSLFATREMPFGYGFGKLPDSLASDDVIKAYLARPLTLYLGTADNVPDEYFDESETAMKQGAGRYQRNIASYEFARDVAKKNGWPFNWRLVIATGIGHDHTAMFDHAQAENALFGR